MTLPEIYTVAHNIHRAFICVRRKKCFYLYPQKKWGPRATPHISLQSIFTNHLCAAHARKACPITTTSVYNFILVKDIHATATIRLVPSHIIHIQYCLASFSINSHHTSKGQLSKTGNEWGIDK